MTKKISLLVALLAGVFFAGGAFCFYLFGKESMLNFEAAYLSALLVIGATIFGYWQMVQGSGSAVPNHDLQDETERIDDRFGLWEEESFESEDAALVLKEEKRRLKSGKRGFREFLKTTKPALSLYRLGAYAVLIYILYKLVSNGVFEPLSYLSGVAAAALTLSTALYIKNRS